MERKVQIPWEQSGAEVTHKLRKFLFEFLNQTQPALLVVDEKYYETICEQLMESVAFVRVSNTHNFRHALEHHPHILLSLDYGSEPALIEDLKHCASQMGRFEREDIRSLERVILNYDVEETKLLAICPSTRFGIIESYFHLPECLPLVERIS